MQQQINFEETERNVYEIKMEILDILKTENPQAYLKFLGEIKQENN